jgi:hypothetical protein
MICSLEYPTNEIEAVWDGGLLHIYPISSSQGRSTQKGRFLKYVYIYINVMS